MPRHIGTCQGTLLTAHNVYITQRTWFVRACVREVIFIDDDRLQGSHFEAVKKYLLLSWHYSAVLCR